MVSALPAPQIEGEAAGISQVEEEATAPATGVEIFIPLDKLKKSPRNARKTPHGTETIETYAASIAAKGILQNLVVEPEFDLDGQPTGFYFVTIGEGRRLAQLLRAKRKEIGKTEPIRCVIDKANDPFEISLDENVSRTDLLPADQFEAFRELAENRGWGAEEIAARFGVTAHVVKQRLRLGAVSPKLMQVYRDGGLNLDQLMAFAVTDDHGRQEQVYDGLPANDRKAIFIGADAYADAGGTILRDLFTEDRGGYFEDAALLDRLVLEKLSGIATELQSTEGWKWAEAFIDYPHAHGLRRVYPQLLELSAEDLAARAAVQEEFDRLTVEWEATEEDLPPDSISALPSLKLRSSALTLCDMPMIQKRLPSAVLSCRSTMRATPALNAASYGPKTKRQYPKQTPEGMAKRLSTVCASTRTAKSSRMRRGRAMTSPTVLAVRQRRKRKGTRHSPFPIFSPAI